MSVVWYLDNTRLASWPAKDYRQAGKIIKRWCERYVALPGDRLMIEEDRNVSA